MLSIYFPAVSFFLSRIINTMVMIYPRFTWYRLPASGWMYLFLFVCPSISRKYKSILAQFAVDNSSVDSVTYLVRQNKIQRTSMARARINTIFYTFYKLPVCVYFDLHLCNEYYQVWALERFKLQELSVN